MLPKPDKKKKKSPEVEQLDLVETLSSFDKVKKKRRALIISLFLTMGLSLLFAVYTRIRFVSFSLPDFSLPSLTQEKALPVSDTPLDSSLQELLPSDLSFSLYLRFQSPSFSDYSYSHQAHNLFLKDNYQTILSSLESLDLDTTSPLAILLPKGVSLQQQQLTSDGRLEVQTLIKVPQRQIFIITLSDPSSFDLQAHSLLIEKIYWLLLK